MLDTPGEERFDRITRICSQAFNVPIAYIALIDSDRQWFKSSCGLSTPETTRESSFCGHAILEPEVLVIPDARLDPRFADNPMVIGPPHIRFYAGQPIAGPGGYNIGTCCIADSEPRQLTAVERSILKETAGLVERELSLADELTLQRKLGDVQQALIESQERLAAELVDAAAYVRSLLPAPLDGEVAAAWRYIPSDDLGGDAFGYRWIDADHFALYLLDVCGHGVGAALFSISVMNLLSAGGLAGVDARRPGQVLGALTEAFPMEQQQGKYFTMWYGVYDRRSRRLEYASGGHPPAILIPAGGADPVRLRGRGTPIGMQACAYESKSCDIPVGSRVYLYSDGIYELFDPSGTLITFTDFLQRLTEAACEDASCLDGLLAKMRAASGDAGFDDDVAVVEVGFS